MTRTEMKERERERQRQNRIPVIAQVKVLSLSAKQFVTFTDAYFYSQLELNNNYLYSFGQRKI